MKLFRGASAGPEVDCDGDFKSLISLLIERHGSGCESVGHVFFGHLRPDGKSCLRMGTRRGLATNGPCKPDIAASIPPGASCVERMFKRFKDG